MDFGPHWVWGGGPGQAGGVETRWGRGSRTSARSQPSLCTSSAASALPLVKYPELHSDLSMYLFSFFKERSNTVIFCPFLGAELKYGHIVVPAQITVLLRLCQHIMCVCDTCDGCWWWRGCGPWPGWAPASRWWPAPRCRRGGPGLGSGSQWCCSPGSPAQCNIASEPTYYFHSRSQFVLSRLIMYSFWTSSALREISIIFQRLLWILKC